MPVYQFTSTCGLSLPQARPVVEREAPFPCPACSGLLRRDFARELATITIAPVPLNFFTQWSDLYDESPREMARRKNVERYDPTMQHKPQLNPIRFDLPRGVEDVDTLIKTIAPVDGRHETDKMLARVAPLPEEGNYS